MVKKKRAARVAAPQRVAHDPVQITVNDESRIAAIMALAEMGKGLARALEVAPQITIRDCWITTDGKAPAIEIKSRERVRDGS